MSYLVLALGGVLAIGGVIVLQASYPIIEVERGWAGVIAGTTALASGVVTFALGLILHRLSSFPALLNKTNDTEDVSSASTPAHSPHYVPKSAPLPDAPVNSPVIGAASGVRSWPQRHARPPHAAGRSGLKPLGAVSPAPLKARDADSASPRTPSPSGGAARLDEVPPDTPGGDSGPELPLDPADTAHASPNGMHLTAESEGQSALRGEFQELERDAEAEHRFEPPRGEEPPAACEGQEHPAISWPPEHALIEALAPEAGQMAHSAEPGAAGDLSPDPTIGGDTLTILRHYEHEGTSYIMYADGSIEARTEHAVFHFKSMAELKSFMETQAQTSKE